MSQSNSSNSTLYKISGIGVGALATAAVVVMVMAQLAEKVDEPLDDITRVVLTKRVLPASSVRTGSSADEEPVVAAAPKTAEELYGFCSSCHDTGAAGAPLKTDTVSWQARIDATGGLAGLVQSAITGKGAMPPRGGSAYSDEEMAKVVKFLSGL